MPWRSTYPSGSLTYTCIYLSVLIMESSTVVAEQMLRRPISHYYVRAVVWAAIRASPNSATYMREVVWAAVRASPTSATYLRAVVWAAIRATSISDTWTRADKT